MVAGDERVQQSAGGGDCPELLLLSDDSFGATTAKLVKVGGQYRECRAAASAHNYIAIKRR
jgi:hypothetical protein